MKRGTFWPYFLGAILVSGVGANVAFLVVASRDPSFAVEKDYYGKALRWDRTQEELRASAALGWTLSLAASPSGRGPGWTRIEARLADRAGIPVENVTIALEAFHHARAADVVAVDLAPAGPGLYAAEIPTRRRGAWEMRLRARRGDDIFTQVVEEELGGLR